MPPGYDIERYLNIRSAYSATFSPDGRRVAFITNITGVPQVWSIGVEGGWPEQLSFRTERVSSVAYSPRDRRLAYGIDKGGSEKTQIHLLSDDGASDVPLTDAPDAIHWFGDWSPDGKRIAFTSNRRNGVDFDLYTLEVESRAPALAWEAKGWNVPVSWARDGKSILVIRATTNIDNDLFLYDVDRGTARHLTPHEGELQISGPSLTSDSRSIYMGQDRDRDFVNLGKFDIETGSWEWLEKRDWDTVAVKLSPDGRWLAHAANVDGCSELVIGDLRGEHPDIKPGLPSCVVADMDFSPDSSRIAASLSGPRHNLDLWLIDLPSGAARQLTRSATGGIPRESFAEPRLVRYRSFDGLEIPAFLYLPPVTASGAKVPVVIDIHGGPEAQERVDFNAIVQYLVRRGYAVLAPNVRGSSGYGKRYIHLDDVRKRMDSVADIKAAHEWLLSEGHADPGRIAVMGGSYGGFMVLSSVCTYPDLWAAAVDIVGISNFVTFLEHTGAYRRALRIAEYGDPVKDREFLESISPLTHADRIVAPLFVIHGSNDPRVPLGEAKQIVESMQRRGKPVEILVFEDEGHGIVKLGNRIKSYRAVADFLDTHIGPA